MQLFQSAFIVVATEKALVIKDSSFPVSRFNQIM